MLRPVPKTRPNKLKLTNTPHATNALDKSLSVQKSDFDFKLTFG